MKFFIVILLLKFNNTFGLHRGVSVADQLRHHDEHDLPSGYIETNETITSSFQGRRYVFVKNSRTTKPTWYEAYVTCQRNGMQILWLDDKNEFDFLVKFIRETQVADRGFESIGWFGAYRFDGLWTNVHSGKPFNTWWKENRPQDTSSSNSINDVCSAIFQKNQQISIDHNVCETSKLPSSKDNSIFCKC